MSINRRRILQSVWITPIVSSVILPTHAQTSTTVPPTSMCSGELEFNLASSFPPLVATNVGQSCVNPVKIHNDLVITNTLGFTARLIAQTNLIFDDSLAVDGVQYPYVCAALTNVPSGTVLKSNIAPLEVTTISVLDTITPDPFENTSASGILRLECQ